MPFISQTINPSRNDAMKAYWHCKRRNFKGEKFRSFPAKTFRMELNFVLSEWLKEVKTRRDDWKVCKPGGRNFGREINFVLFFYFTKARKLNSLRKFLLLQYQNTLSHLSLVKLYGKIEMDWSGGPLKRPWGVYRGVLLITRVLFWESGAVTYT